MSAGPGETRFPNSSRDELIRSTDDKVRDAKYRNDAAEIVSAYDRYYATQGAYPWGNGMTLINKHLQRVWCTRSSQSNVCTRWSIV